MKNLKMKNIPFTVYSLLSIGLGMTIAVSVLSIILPILFSITGNEMPGWYQIGVNLEPVTGKISSLQNNDYLINRIEGMITIFKQSSYLMFLNNLIPILTFCSLSCGIYLLRKIIKNVYEGKHFSRENLKYMRIIAILVLVVPHIQVLLQNIIVGSLPKDLMLNGFKVTKVLPGPINIFAFSFVPNYIILGLLILIFAEVFREGNVIKEEIDLTV